MKSTQNFSTIITQEHEKKWVALSKDFKRVISSNASLVELKRTIGSDDVVYMKVPPADVYLSFLVTTA